MSMKREEPLSVTFGRATVTATRREAWAGPSGRVYVDPRLAVEDLAMEQMAAAWVSRPDSSGRDMDAIKFGDLLEDMTVNIDLYESIFALAKWRREQFA